MSMFDLLLDPKNLQLGAGLLDFAGKMVSANESDQYADDTRAAAAQRAQQMRVNAGQQIAAAQREALDARAQSELIASRALAVAAASGGGASDPTVVNMIAKAASAGAYKQSLALYQGREAARQINAEADATIQQGNLQAQRAEQEATGQRMRAATSVLGSFARYNSLRQKYGGDGPVMAAVSGASAGAASGAGFMDAGTPDFFSGAA